MNIDVSMEMTILIDLLKPDFRNSRRHIGLLQLKNVEKSPAKGE
jgi:hypothetical protein